MDIQTVTAASEKLKAAGVDHIVLADGRILVEGSRESSRIAVQKWRKSKIYKKYTLLKEKHGPNGTGKLGIKGGYTLRKTPDGKDYKLVKLSPDEIKGLKRRAAAQRASSLMGKSKKKTSGKGGGGSAAPKKVAKPEPKKVVKKVAPKVAPKKVVKPAPKKVVKPGKKVVKRSRD